MPTMDEQFDLPQNHGLPLSNLYDKDEDSSMQSPLETFSFDNFLEQDLDQPFMATTPLVSHILPETYRAPTHFPMPQITSMWNSSGRCSPDFTSQHGKGDDYSFDSSSYITASGNDGTVTRGRSYSGIPRIWEQYNPLLSQETTGPNFDHGNTAEKNERDVQGQVQGCENNGVGIDYSSMEASQLYQSPGVSQSATQDSELARAVLQNEFMGADGLPFDKPTPFSMPSDSLSEDGNIPPEMTGLETDEQGADEPYAKLIYRALMSAPNHSMVLQEIYQWFRDHTSKGSSDSKGWMNSIRHNLSMNAAFKKTERKCPGDDIKKSTEWVLEDFAIKDGVQSTTRYRKGTAYKKFNRSESPVASRQRSGRKGGISAAKSSGRFRRRYHNRPSSVPRIDTFSQPHLHHSHSLNERQRLPLTPPYPEADGLYPFQKLDQGYDLDFEQMYGLEDVQGVHIDDSPLFAANYDMQYHGFPAISNHELGY